MKARDADRIRAIKTWALSPFGEPCGICQQPIRAVAMFSPDNGFVCEPCGRHERDLAAA